MLSYFFLDFLCSTFLLNCGIFKKFSNQTLQSLKIIIWNKKSSFGISKLLFGINFCSYLIEPYQNFSEEILTNNVLGIEVGLKLFLILTLEMVVKPLERIVLTH